MNVSRSLSSTILLAALVSLILAGCSPVRDIASQPTDTIRDVTSQPTDPITEIRRSLELPELPFEFVENTGMANSPSGRLEVANYRDREGRIYSVNPKTNQVVEIDARAILPNIPANAPSLSPELIKAKAKSFAATVIPDFDSLQSSLQYEEGGKIDNYFFTWYGEVDPGSMNRPFLQFGFHKSGALFAYYNTLSLEE